MSDDIFSNPPKISYEESEPNIQVDEFIKVIQTRRSVRFFDGKSIPEHVVNSCLDLALLAPNSSNLQPWTFYWVRTPKVKEELIKACLSQPAAKTAGELIVCAARIGTWKENQNRMLEQFKNNPQVPKQAIHYYQVLVPMIYNQGLFNLVGFLKKFIFFLKGFKTPVVREPTSTAEMITWATKSTALACENLMLAFRAYSYDTCPMEGYDSVRIKKLLDLPSDAHITMVIAAGKRDIKGIYGPRLRFDRKHYIKEV
jgi:nitroreductase